MARKAKPKHVKPLDNGAVAIVDRRLDVRGIVGPGAGGFVGINDDGSEDWSAIAQALEVAAGMSERLDGNGKGGSHTKRIINNKDLQTLADIIEMAMSDDLRHYKSLTYQRWAKRFHPLTAPAITDALIRAVRKSIDR